MVIGQLANRSSALTCHCRNQFLMQSMKLLDASENTTAFGIESQFLSRSLVRKTSYLRCGYPNRIANDYWRRPTPTRNSTLPSILFERPPMSLVNSSRHSGHLLHCAKLWPIRRAGAGPCSHDHAQAQSEFPNHSSNVPICLTASDKDFAAILKLV